MMDVYQNAGIGRIHFTAVGTISTISDPGCDGEEHTSVIVP